MIEWATLAWPEIEGGMAGRVALLPVGAIEEHGPHMAVGADWHAAEALGRRVAQANDLVLLPTLPFGQVWSLASFAGTLSLSDQTLTSVVTDLATGLRQAGVAGLVMLSCHLGNMAALKQASRHLWRGQFPSLSLFYPGLSEASAAFRTTPEFSREVVHADEVETSILLALAPQDVDMDRAQAEWPQFPPEALSTAEPWRDYSTSGVFGDPTAATAEKGYQILEIVEQRTVELIGSWRARHGF